MAKKKVLMLVVLYAAIAMLLYSRFPMRDHWMTAFRPAALLMASGKSPYSVITFFNPPWALIPVIPFALLPERIGWALYGAFSLGLFGFVAWRLGAKPLIWALFMLLPQTLYSGFQVNVDALVALGLILPPQLGLFFILIKPQIGIGLAVYWLFDAWRQGGLKTVFSRFAPVSLAFLLSFLLYGPWILQSQSAVSASWNRSIFPALLPVGLVLLVTAIKTKRSGLAFTSSIFFSPYYAFYSYPLAALGILSNGYQSLAAIAGLWLASFSEGWLYQILVGTLVSGR